MQEMGPTPAEHVGEGERGNHVRVAETCEAWEKGDPSCTHMSAGTIRTVDLLWFISIDVYAWLEETL